MRATTLLIAAALALTALAGAATAHGPYTVTKSGLKPSNFGGVGLALYFDASRLADPTTEAPLECGLQAGGGFAPSPCGPGALPQVDGAHHHHPFAVGTCTVAPGSPKVGSGYSFLCGTDRNDDGFVSDAPVCAIEDDTAVGVAHVVGSAITLHDECTGEVAIAGFSFEEHADDWVVGVGAAPVPFCFQDDVRGFTDTPADDTGLAGDDISAVNQAVFPVEHGDGWDDIVVLVESLSNFGAAVATLTIAGAPACGAATGGLVSAHATPGNADTDGNGRDTTECMDTVDNEPFPGADDDLIDAHGYDNVAADPECQSGFGGTPNPGDDDESV